MDEASPTGIHRIVTSHDESGRAIVRFDDETPMLDVTPEHATFSVRDEQQCAPLAASAYDTPFRDAQVVWTTDSSPADNTDGRDGAQKPVWSGGSHNANGGSVLRIVDIPPHTQSPMHRTQSLDYGIVIWGEIELELDSGEKRTLGTSDICVQRGTDHLWRNKTDRSARIAFVLLDANPVAVNGATLPDKGFPDGKH